MSELLIIACGLLLIAACIACWLEFTAPDEAEDDAARVYSIFASGDSAHPPDTCGPVEDGGAVLSNNRFAGRIAAPCKDATVTGGLAVPPFGEPALFADEASFWPEGDAEGVPGGLGDCRPAAAPAMTGAGRSRLRLVVKN